LIISTAVLGTAVVVLIIISVFLGVKLAQKNLSIVSTSVSSEGPDQKWKTESKDIISKEDKY